MQDLAEGFFSVFPPLRSSQGKVRRGCSTERRGPYRFNLKMWVWADQWLTKYMKRLESPLVRFKYDQLFTPVLGFCFILCKRHTLNVFSLLFSAEPFVSLSSAFWGMKICEPETIIIRTGFFALFPQSRMGRLRPLLFCTAVLRAPIASGHDECTDRRSKLVSHSSHQGSLGPLKATKYNMKTFTLACIHLSRTQTGRGSLAHFHSSLPWVSLREVELPCRD